MSELAEKIAAACAAIREVCDIKPRIGIVLGTGLGKLAEEISDKVTIPYTDIPHFPTPTLEYHVGQLVFGKLAGKDVMAMEGRYHFYEGHSMEEITLPVRVAKALGAEVLVVSNAAGGMNPMYDAGDIVIIEDHINLMGLAGIGPLVGPNDESLGERFPDMCEPYDSQLIRVAEDTALELGIRAHKGVYVIAAGPNLETRAEYRFLRGIGADVVGMSTVPEVVVAVHSGMKVLGLSIVTDRCLPDALEPVDIKRIIKTANDAEPKLTKLVIEVLKRT